MHLVYTYVTVLFKMLFAFLMGSWHIFCHVAEVALLLYSMLALFDTMIYGIA